MKLHAITPTPSFDLLKDFINPQQLATVHDCLQGEEAPFFIDKLNEIAGIITSMPTVMDECEGDTFYLHYFMGGFDWFISKKDIILNQTQAFGYADLGCGELGSISIKELLDNHVSLDFHFKPSTLAEVKHYHQ